MDSEMMNKLAMLSALRGQDDEAEIYVSSFNEAILLLQQHMMPSGAKYRRQLVDFVTDPANEVLADCDVIHNFIMDLFRVGDYALSIKVCDYALSFAPHHRDILGDAIKACGDSSQFDLGEQYLVVADSIPKKYWSYRLFLYSVDFLKTKLNAYPEDEALYDRALALANEYVKYFPYDEHGYNQRAELLVAANRREDAIEDLKISITAVQPDAHVRTSALVCAQCCVTLLNLLDDSNDYDFIAEICDIGMRNTTQEQPSAAIGFFMYRKALALDAKAHVESFRAEDTIVEALKCYQAAYDLNQDRSYAKTIEQRYAVLRPKVEKLGKFTPLVKRKFYITESNTAQDDE